MNATNELREMNLMTEKRFIRGGDCYSSRYLHSDEKFRKEINWNINLPKEREFKSGECIVTDKDDTAYHIDEVVELLNNLHEENKKLDEKYIDEFSLRETLQQELQRVENENEQLKQRIKELMKEVDALSDGEADWLIEEML